MLKIIRRVLYGLAITAGLTGLIGSSIPLVEYVRERFRTREYDFYDTTYLHAPEIIFLLSLILLVCVHIGLLVGQGVRLVSLSDPALKPEPSEDTPPPANVIPAPAATVPQPRIETADDKLAQLLDQKKK